MEEEKVDGLLAESVDIEERMLRTTAEAYQRASSKTDAEEECEYLERMGVLLPNGFTPMPPMFSEAGEELLKSFYS